MATETTELVVQSTTPVELLRMAVSQGADIDKLEKLMALQERWEKNEARKGFVEALSAFKSHAIQILKDKTNKQYESKYVSLGNLVTTVTPFLSKHGLSCRWDLDQSAGIKVSCIMTHVAGHSESVSMTVPPDTSGAKNPIQQIKSAITYAKACTFESICGLASSDANVDDDANGASNSDLLSADKVSEQVEWIGNARNKDELQKLFQNAYKEASDAGDKGAQKRYIAAKDARRKELQ